MAATGIMFHPFPLKLISVYRCGLRPIQTATRRKPTDKITATSLEVGSHRIDNLLLKPTANKLHESVVKLPGGTPIISSGTGLPVPTGEEVKHRYLVNTRTAYRTRIKPYLSLAKYRLTGLVVITTIGGYILCPSTTLSTFCLSTFLLTTVGTWFMSCSANSLNQLLEVPFDSQMNRTRGRPLVTGRLSPLQALMFASSTGLAGLSTLYLSVNPVAAGLGLLTLLLYAGVYTPMKRYSIGNTWCGAVVGALPPVLGWTAASGGAFHLGALSLGLLLYSWQFPHFNSLSWNLRGDYSRAGYHMTALCNPKLCRVVALRHSLAMLPISLSFPYFSVTTWYFPFAALLINLPLIYLSVNFYRDPSRKTSRTLFFSTLFHLPLIFILLLVCKV